MRVLLILIIGLLSIAAFAQDNEGIETDLTCETCHASGDWTSDVGANFNHITTGFELKGTHGEIDCGRCHTGSSPAEKHNFAQASSDCIACHEDIHNDQWGEDCERCHSPDTWTLSTQQQNHDLTNFPLRGPHRSLGCENCHLSNTDPGSSLPLDCAGCHSQQYESSSNPPHQILNLGNDCESCHESQSTQWTLSSFNHNSTGFTLIGMHNASNCENCHTQSVKNTPKTCVGCHTADYDNSSDPPHLASGYPKNCNSCHDSFTWNSTFTHDRTGFLLEGAHTETPCSGCHPGQSFYNAESSCRSCHLGEWESSTLPPHADAEFDENCQDCHTVVDWVPSIWNHDTDTEYPLTGAHIVVPGCELCHTVVPYSEQPSECVDCHLSNYNETIEPNHITSGIPTTCGICHTTENWTTEQIDHSLTAFPLLGAHAEIECATCHASGYDLPTECAGCHLPDYTSTANSASPDHAQYGFSQDCVICHGQVAWKPSSFDHDADLTGFAIQGAHLTLLPENCYACHDPVQWTGLSSDCSSCHQSNFENTSDPDHGANGYPQNLCETCHSQEGWSPSIFAHTTTSIACESCHMVQYTGTINPPHTELSFPTDCSSCHTVEQWSPSSFVHDVETTGFLTDGAHLQTSCNSCHETWEPPSEIRTCASASCHLENFSVSTNPPHETMNFSQNCVDCHTTTAWTPSGFQHTELNTGYALEGAHVSVECQSCHTPWQIIPEPRTCGASTCHLSNYNSATDPNHAAASFPLQCETCHSTTAWEPSTFDHDGEFFPIYSGQHRNEWNDCSQCHIDVNDYAVFTCYGAGCHGVAEMNSEHFDDGSYVSCRGNTYNPSTVTPTDCFTCHPNGDGDDCDGGLLNFFKMRTLPQPKEAKPHELD
jgi:hypothetical protein